MQMLISFLLLLLFLVSPCYASDAIVIVVGQPLGVPSYCTSCTGTSDADLGCEDWEGSEQCTWREDENGAEVDTSHSPSGAWTCTDIESQNLEITIPDQQAYDSLIEYDLGSEVKTLYMQFYLKFTTDIVATEEARIFGGMRDSESNYSFYLSLFEDSGSVYLKLRYYDTGASQTALDSTNTLTKNTAYRIRIRTDAVNNDLWWWIDGDAQTNVTDLANRGVQYPFFGSQSATDPVTFEVDNIKFDDNTMAGVCSGDS